MVSVLHIIAEWRYLQNEVQLSCFNIPIVMLPRFENQVAKIFGEKCPINATFTLPKLAEVFNNFIGCKIVPFDVRENKYINR